MMDWSYWVDKAREYRDNGKYDDAIHCYERILEYNSMDTFALTMIGCCYSESGRFNKALTFLNEALDIDPKNFFIWFNKGCVLLDNEKYLDAIKCFDKAISLRQDDSFSWYFKGTCYYYLNDFHTAIDCFEISYDLEPSEEKMQLINNLKSLGVGTNHTSSSSRKQCPNCGRYLNESAINCGYCGYSFGSGNRVGTSHPPISGMKECPNCGVRVKENKKVCPKCNYNFKKSKINKPKAGKSQTNKPILVKHFDNGIVSFDYPDDYSRDYNSQYEKIDIFASFKIGSTNNFDSAFAIFDGEPVSNEIPDSKFKEVIKKSFGSDVLDIDRYSFGEKERIIIKTQNSSGNIEYRCNVPEIGFSVLFIIPSGKEYLFNEKYVSTVVNSLEKSTGKSIPKKVVKTCPNCGAENSDDSNFCIECGVKLDVSEDVNFCIYCGTEVVPGAKFCLNCGKLIEY